MIKVTVEFDGETKVYEGDFFAGVVMAYQNDGAKYSSFEILRGVADVGDALCAIAHMAAVIAEKKYLAEDINEND